MNILIIGGNGYIGRHLAVRLKGYGHRISIVDNNDVPQLPTTGYSINIGDFGVVGFMNEVLKNERAELVIHAGGLSDVSDSMAAPMMYYTNNVVGNVFLIDTLISNNVKKVVYISSAAVFGEQEKLPITKTSLRNPISTLGHTQMLVESMLESFRLSHNISYAIVRAPNLAGLSENEDPYFVENFGTGLIPAIMECALGWRDHLDIYGTTYGTIDGTAERDYLHIDDFCDACVNVLPHLEVRREKQIFNVGLGKAHSVKEVIACAEEVIGKKIKTTDLLAREGDPSRIYYDVFEACAALDWRPKYGSLKDIIVSIWEKIKLSNKE